MKVINPKCPECGGTMRDGFLLDQTNEGYKVLRWVEGIPEKSIWVGLKLKGRAQWKIVTYRCPDCGFLKSYAREQVK